MVSANSDPANPTSANDMSPHRHSSRFGFPFKHANASTRNRTNYLLPKTHTFEPTTFYPKNNILSII
jgi:hypothetical protein